MQARQIMTPNPKRISERAKVRDALELLSDLDVRHLPVVNDANEVVGMLSDRDLRGLSLPDIVGASFQSTVVRALDSSVSTIMSSSVIAVDEEDEVEDVVDAIVDNKVGAVCVTGNEGELVGIISYIDVLRNAQFS
jgi:acetoin utilization protein AcuB